MSTNKKRYVVQPVFIVMLPEYTCKVFPGMIQCDVGDEEWGQYQFYIKLETVIKRDYLPEKEPFRRMSTLDHVRHCRVFYQDRELNCPIYTTTERQCLPAIGRPEVPDQRQYVQVHFQCPVVHEDDVQVWKNYLSNLKRIESFKEE